MKDDRRFISILFVLFFIVNIYSNTAIAQVNGTWTGTVKLRQSMESTVGTSLLEITTYFSENIGTGSMKFDAESGVGNIRRTVSCNGGGSAELHNLSISVDDSSYYIHVIGPTFSCSPPESAPGQDGRDITISDYFTRGGANNLSGSKSTVTDIGIGKVTKTISWNLVRTVDVVLIVTPKVKAPLTYDTWLPIPGRDELTKGSVVEINLKLQRRNGQPSSLKADEFELRLINTSIEPGITINFPLSPRANQLPDLRFIGHPAAESDQADQLITLPPVNGLTGKAYIGCYDGGAYTTLNVYALLENGIRIKGELLVPGGEQDILIPKRKPGSIIATAWLTANDNPPDAFDEEESPGNTNNGDGLSAYEEYRGVISFREHLRLNPQKKELGILPKDSEIGIFFEGFKKFQNASGIRIIQFDKSEIPENRRLNQNASSAHIFKQFVLRISKGNIGGERDIYNQTITAWGICYPTNDIPARVTHIVIDVDRIRRSYQETLQAMGAANVPFTDNDLVASTTAHEIGHGVSIPHHGRPIPPLPGFRAESNPPRIYYVDARASWEVTDRPYQIDGPIGLPGNHESGNVSCFMCYRNKSRWVRFTQNNNTVYYKVPLLAAGTIFCIEKKGTGINSNNNYFGDAINGECLGGIKLKD